MSRDADKAFFGHPIGLSTLFASEMWERFSYYGMRALLVLFLTATFASGGFEMAELDAFTIYGIFTGLVYVTPILGGMLADCHRRNRNGWSQWFKSGHARCRNSYQYRLGR